jgi:hypothetical protein
VPNLPGLAQLIASSLFQDVGYPGGSSQCCTQQTGMYIEWLEALVFSDFVSYGRRGRRIRLSGEARMERRLRASVKEGRSLEYLGSLGN